MFLGDVHGTTQIEGLGCDEDLESMFVVDLADGEIRYVA